MGILVAPATPTETPLAFQPVVWVELPWQGANKTHPAIGGLANTESVSYGVTGSSVQWTYPIILPRWCRGARQGLAGDGRYTFKRLTGTGGAPLARLGLYTDPWFDSITGGASLLLAIDLGGTIYEGATSVGSTAISDVDAFSFERSGNSYALKKGATTLRTITSASTLYLIAYTYAEGTDGLGWGWQACQVEGVTTDTATPSAAPTLVSVTASHKRLHVRCTFPTNANGVNAYLATTDGGHDFTQPCVREARDEYFDIDTLADGTPLVNGTTYFVRLKATQEGLAWSAASAQLSATPTTNSLPAVDSVTKVLLGAPAQAPIDRVGNGLSFWAEDTRELVSHLKFFPTRSLFYFGGPTGNAAGTVAMVNGSRRVTGTGTDFLTEYGGFGIRSDRLARLWDPDAGVWRLGLVKFVYSDTELDLWDAWFYPSAAGQPHRCWWSPTNDNDGGNCYSYLNFYDLGARGWQTYYRTGSEQIRSLARVQGDSYGDYLKRIYDNDGTFPAPLIQSFLGVAHRARDRYLLNNADIQLWTTLVADMAASWAIWIHNGSTFAAEQTVRYQAYQLQYAAAIAAAHYDASTRASWYTKAFSQGAQFFQTWQDRYTDKVPRLRTIETIAGMGYQSAGNSSDPIIASATGSGGVVTAGTHSFIGIWWNGYGECSKGPVRAEATVTVSAGQKISLTLPVMSLGAGFADRKSVYMSKAGEQATGPWYLIDDNIPMATTTLLVDVSDATLAGRRIAVNTLLTHYHQPWHNAILGEAYAMLYHLAATQGERDNVATYFLALWATGTGGMLEKTWDGRAIVPDAFGSRDLRIVYYDRYHNKISEGDTVPADVLASDALGTPYDPALSAPITRDPNIGAPDERLTNGIAASNMGFAYYLTGNTAYTTRGDAILQSIFGGTNGRATDGLMCIAELFWRGKEANEAGRTLTYRAYRDVVAHL